MTSVSLPISQSIDLDKVFVVIPALNEANRIGNVLTDLDRIGFTNVIVVSDGSTDNTMDVVQAFNPNYCVLEHVVNLGPGASTMTGIQFALEQGAEVIATIDADHQHDPQDIKVLLAEMSANQHDLVIGSRFKQSNDIPPIRIAYNFVGNLVSFVKTGVFVSDSQSGLKIMSRHFAEKIVIEYNGFEFCIDIIRNARLNKVSIGEAPINVRYTEDTMSKGQSFFSGVMMLGKLLNPFSN